MENAIGDPRVMNGLKTSRRRCTHSIGISTCARADRTSWREAFLTGRIDPSSCENTVVSYSIRPQPIDGPERKAFPTAGITNRSDIAPRRGGWTAHPDRRFRVV